MSQRQQRERRRYRRLWLLAVVLFALTLLFSTWWFGPAPPRQITLATGQEEGTYAALGSEYQKRLDALGLKVRLHPTQGSLENLHLLLSGKVDAAFVQAGMYEYVKEQDKAGTLRVIQALQWEPVWVFYRGSQRKSLPEFPRKTPAGAKLKIAIGPPASGIAALANAILQANGLDAHNAALLHLSMTETAVGLEQGTLDMGFFVSSAQNPLIQKLLRQEANEALPAESRVRLLSFGRQLAYSRRFPFLQPVVLGEGVVDLGRNIPHQDVKMFATSTLLVCRAGFHPRAVEQLLIAARPTQNRLELITTEKVAPSLDELELPIHESAETYMRSGESLVARLLPYWGVWLLFKLKILLLPLLIMWLPFFRMLPLVYSARINWLLRQHYAALRTIEDDIEKCGSSSQLHEQIAALDHLRKNMERLSRKIPTHLQINVYQWRLHVAHVRAEATGRLKRLQGERPQSALPATESAPEPPVALPRP